jgi:hypothetical protein
MCRANATIAVLNEAIHATSGFTQYMPSKAASITTLTETWRMVHLIEND